MNKKLIGIYGKRNSNLEPKKRWSIKGPILTPVAKFQTGLCPEYETLKAINLRPQRSGSEDFLNIDSVGVGC